MPEEALARAMEEELEQTLKRTETATQHVADSATGKGPVQLRPQASLAEQWSKVERVGADLRERARKERQQIISNYDRNVVELQTAYNEKIENTVAMLKQDEQIELRRLADDTAAKLREHELLIKRMG